MSHRILIVDDDPDFASLMGDIFSHGGYEVQTVARSEEVPALLDKESFDMVVSDLEMPSLSGSELARHIRDTHPDIPIVMVSGYLDESRIESLRADGVVDFFNKPLNIFSLLRKTETILLNRKPRPPATGDAESSPSSEKGGSPADDAKAETHSFPGRAAASREFMSTLRREVGKQSHIVLVGAPGSPECEIGRDVSRWIEEQTDGAVACLRGEAISEDLLRSILEKTRQEGRPNLMLYLYDSEHLSLEQQTLLYTATRPHPFGTDWTSPTRLILVVQESLDDLLQEQALTESLYLLLGGIELNIPTLNECPEDIEPIAEAILSRIRPDHPPQLTPEAGAYLRSLPWEGNWRELESILATVVKEGEGTKIDLSDLREVTSPS